MDYQAYFLCMGICCEYNNLQQFLIKIFELVKEQKRELIQSLNKEMNNLENFDFDDSNLCEFNFLSENIYNCLAIFLYSFTEKSLKKLLCLDLNKNVNIKNINKQFESTYHFNITEIQKYNIFNELRLVNNCIKHSGIVDKNLVKYNKYKEWKQGETIILTENDIKVYFNNLADFITDMFTKITKTENFVISHIE